MLMPSKEPRCFFVRIPLIRSCAPIDAFLLSFKTSFQPVSSDAFCFSVFRRASLTIIVMSLNSPARRRLTREVENADTEPKIKGSGEAGGGKNTGGVEAMRMEIYCRGSVLSLSLPSSRSLLLGFLLSCLFFLVFLVSLLFCFNVLKKKS